MGEVTIGRLVRLFLKIEAVGIAIVVLGALMDLNPFIISLGIMVMIPGFGLLSLAGTLKALERSVLASERHQQRMGEMANEAEEEV